MTESLFHGSGQSGTTRLAVALVKILTTPKRYEGSQRERRAAMMIDIPAVTILLLLLSLIENVSS